MVAEDALQAPRVQTRDSCSDTPAPPPCTAPSSSVSWARLHQGLKLPPPTPPTPAQVLRHVTPWFLSRIIDPAKLEFKWQHQIKTL